MPEMENLGTIKSSKSLAKTNDGFNTARSAKSVGNTNTEEDATGPLPTEATETEEFEEEVLEEVEEEYCLEDELAKFINRIDEQQEDRDRELFEFLEELINSDEYLNRIEREDKTTQVLERHLDKFEKEVLEYIEATRVIENPDTKYTQRMWSAEQKIKKILAAKEERREKKKLEKSVFVIKRKIDEAAETHRCHLKVRGDLELNKIENEASRLDGDLFDSTKWKVAERVVSLKKIKHFQKIGRQQRTKDIVRKLVWEHKRWKEIVAAKNKSYDYKVRRKERIIKRMAVIGTKYILLPRRKPIEDIIEEEPEEVIPEEVEKPKGRKGKGQKGDQADQKAKGKGKKPEKEKKDKKDKKDKKNKEPVEEELVLPYVPITNVRQKATPDEIQIMDAFIDDYYKLPIIKEELEINEKSLGAKKLDYEYDSNFGWSPRPVVFKDFDNNKKYTSKLTIVNGGDVPKKCKVHKIFLNDGFDARLIDIEKFGIAYISPGMSITVTITFTPIDLKEITHGKIVLITYKSHPDNYSQFWIPITCIPAVRDIIIRPKTVRFEPTPIWKAKAKSTHKSVDITNTRNSRCKIAIRKFYDPLENRVFWKQSYTYDSESENLSKSELANPQNTERNSECDDIDIPFNSKTDIPKDIYKELVMNTFNIFAFDHYFADLQPNSGIRINVSFQNADYVGYYFEKFVMDIFEENDRRTFNCIGNKEIVITGETTGHFIQVEPDILDFEVCVFDSVYQQNIKVFNMSNIPQRIYVKFPVKLRNYLSSSAPEMCIRAGDCQDVAIRFIPRKNISEGNIYYYDLETSILEFPIQLCVGSINDMDAPPVKVTVYAVLAEKLGLAIKPIERDYVSVYDNVFLLDMGECTTREVVYTRIGVTNFSYSSQHFGFLDLPQCVTISPNYGFGQIEPLESKLLKIMINAEHHDLESSKYVEANSSNILTFRITLTTIKSIGGIKKRVNNKYLNKALLKVEILLKTDTPNLLQSYMDICVLYLSTNEDFIQSLGNRRIDDEECWESTGGSYKHENSVQESETIENDAFAEVGPKFHKNIDNGVENAIPVFVEKVDSVTFDMIKSNKIWLQCTASDPLCTFSYQHVEFPDTPCGSYSVMSVDLMARENVKNIDCLCGFINKDKVPYIDYIATFKIVGNNNDIRIEPICGQLENGESIKLTIIANPEIPANIVEQKAKAIKTEELVEKKREELILKRQKEMEAKRLKEEKKAQEKAAKDKKNKKAGKGKGKNEVIPDDKPPVPVPQPEPLPLPEIIINEKDIIITYFNLYPAEMCLWRAFEPYTIEAEFVCEVTYESKKMQRKREILYLTAACKVIMPDFTHDLETHHINFGPTAIGMRRRTTVSFQNIQRDPIFPKISFLSPVGPFSCSAINTVTVPSEYVLKLPINFEPYEEREVKEYFEIKSGKTICPLMVSGKGVLPQITILPEFLVCRLQIDDEFVDCSIEIVNRCEASVSIKFDRVFELEGEMKVLEKPAEDTGDKKGGKKDKKGKKDKSSKGKGKKEAKILKFSPELTENEAYSLENFFNKRGRVASLFEILDGNVVEVPANSKKPVKIRFGITPPPPPEEEGKGKKGKKADKKSKSSKSSSKKGKKRGPKDEKYYIAKFNIMLGNSTFFKDFIVIGNYL